METLRGQVVNDVPRSEVWELYGNLQLAKLCETKLPGFEKVNVVEGNGGVGTVREIICSPGPEVALTYKEKFTKVDNEKCLKEVEVIEGGCLDLGFTLYRCHVEVITKEGDANSCILKSTIEYEVKEEFAPNPSFVTIKPLQEMQNWPQIISLTYRAHAQIPPLLNNK